MKKILVIGGTGNIGHALCEELLSRGHDVTAIGLENKFLTLDPAVHLDLCDRNDEAQMRKVLDGKRFDVIYDMVAFTQEQLEMDYRLFPECEQIIITSSAAVYGIASIQDMPVREDAPLIPARPYGVNKLKVERKAMEYHAQHGWPVTIMRPSSCFGTQPAIFREIGMESSWIDRIQKGKPFASGNPQIVRNVLHVKDVALGFALAMEHASTTIGQAYNLVGATTLSWGQWYDAVMKALGKRVEAVEIPIETLKAFGCPTMEQYEMSWQYHGFYSGDKLLRDMPEFCERVPLDVGVSGQIEFLMSNHLIPNSDEIRWEDAAIAAQLNTRTVGRQGQWA